MEADHGRKKADNGGKTWRMEAIKKEQEVNPVLYNNLYPREKI